MNPTRKQSGPSAPSTSIAHPRAWLKAAARILLPVEARLALHRRYEMVGESVERLLGRHDPLVPPARLMFVGGSRHDFRALGEKWLRTFVRTAGLKTDESVLDIGCGVGRMAVALTHHLSSRGRYEGFDIVNKGIEWCEQEITPRFPNFRFRHADIYNKEYNPGGRIEASDYRFPFPDESFDFAFCTSVFTHMLPADVRHYLSEVQRVLKPGARCLATFFLLDAEAMARVQAGRVDPLRSFRHDLGGYWAVDPRLAEAAVAYSEAAVRKACRQVGLKIREPILHGAWSGRQDPRGQHSQDIVIAER